MGIADAKTRISVPYLDLGSLKNPLEEVSRKLAYPLYHGALVSRDSDQSVDTHSGKKAAETGSTTMDTKFSDALCDRYDESLFAPIKSFSNDLDLDVVTARPNVTVNPAKGSALTNQFGSFARKSRPQPPPPIELGIYIYFLHLTRFWRCVQAESVFSHSSKPGCRTRIQKAFVFNDANCKRRG